MFRGAWPQPGEPEIDGSGTASSPEAALPAYFTSVRSVSGK
jgi:hypothetical protein